MVAAEGLGHVREHGQGLADLVDVGIGPWVIEGVVAGEQGRAHGAADVVFLFRGEILGRMGNGGDALDRRGRIVAHGRAAKTADGPEHPAHGPGVLAADQQNQGRKQAGNTQQEHAFFHFTPPWGLMPPWARKASRVAGSYLISSIRSMAA